MIVDAVFLYYATVIRGRKRNPEAASFSGRVTVEVREADLSDLPVAMRWHRTVERAPSGPHEVRWDGENLWEELHTYEPARGFGEPGVSRMRDPAWLLTRADYRSHDCNQGGDNLDPLMVAPARGRHRYPFVEEALDVRRVVTSEFDLRAAQVAAAASRLIVAGGKLLGHAREPVVRLGHDGFVVCQPRNLSGSIHWRADEAGVMPGGGPPPGDGIEILIPEAVRAPLPVMAMRDLAGLVARHLPPEADEVAAELWIAGSEVTGLLNAGKPVDGGRLAAALSGALAVADPALDRQAGGAYLPGSAREEAEAALARHDARSFAFDGPSFG